MLPRLGVTDVDLWERRELPPRLVANACLQVACNASTCATTLLRVPISRFGVGNQRAIATQERLVGVEPIHVGRLRAILKYMVKGPESATRMIEDAIKNHAHAARVCAIKQFAQRLVATEHRINVEVVIRVVAVI